MRFFQNGVQALLALSAVLAGANGAPTSDSPVADDAAANILSQREVTVIPQGIAPLDKRDDAPGYGDFVSFLAAEPQKSMVNKGVVFWSGTGQNPPQVFAGNTQRCTIEMLLANKPDWDKYGKLKSKKGTQPDWDTAAKNFWNPFSQALAEATTGEAYVLLSATRDSEQKDPTNRACQSCWFRTEKPILLQSLASGRVTKITKFLDTSNGQPVGQINSISDKI